ncbi:MAG: hypothetical protein ACOYI5_09260 [Christensenellales bacterium]|jgi:hypothetical protein
MSKSNAFVTNMRVSGRESFSEKMMRFAKAAGIDAGKDGNLAFLCPDDARKLVSHIKSRGGKPFLTAASTRCVGSRDCELINAQ